MASRKSSADDVQNLAWRKGAYGLEAVSPQRYALDIGLIVGVQRCSEASPCCQQYGGHFREAGNCHGGPFMAGKSIMQNSRDSLRWTKENKQARTAVVEMSHV